MNPENPRASVDVTDMMPTPIDVTDRLTEEAKAEIMGRQQVDAESTQDNADKVDAAREAIESAAPTGPIIETMPPELVPAEPEADVKPAPEVITGIPENLV